MSARFPGGLTVHLDALPVDLFVELVPAMMVIPETRFELLVRLVVGTISDCSRLNRCEQNLCQRGPHLYA